MNSSHALENRFPVETGAASGASGGMSVTTFSLLLFSSAVVVVSLFLIFSYVTGVYGRQTDLETSFQALMTEESALAMLRHELSTGAVSDLAHLPRYSIDDQTTGFQLLEVTPTPPESFSWELAGDSALALESAGRSLFLLSRSGEGLIVEYLSDPGAGLPQTLDRFPGYRFGSLGSVHAAAGTCSGRPFLFLAEPALDGTRLRMVVPGESTQVFSTDIPAVGEDAIMTAGSYRDAPAVLISDGGCSGRMFVYDSTISLPVHSPPGTTPLLLQRGNLFGNVGKASSSDVSTNHSHLAGDYTSDGFQDIVFIGSDRVTLYSGATGSIITDSLREFSPVAWGAVEEENLLSVRWQNDSGGERWRILLDGRFTDSPGPEFLPFDWRGELHSYRRSLLGTVSSSLIVANIGTGSIDTLCGSSGSRLLSVDSPGIDVAWVEADRASLTMDPVSGAGMMLEMLVRTTEEGGEVLCENVWLVRLYHGGRSNRVTVERAV